MKVNHIVILFLMFSFVACVPTANTSRNQENSSDTSDITKRHQVSLIEVSENQMVINGSNLSTITSVKSKYGPQTINLNILSKSDNTVRLSVPNGAKLIAGFIYDLVITDAFGQSTTSISFDVQDNTISTSKIQDGSITNAKLSSLGASSAGQVLQYDGSSWVAVNYNGGSNYLGRIEVGFGAPSVSGLSNGDFYVVDDAAPVTTDLNGNGNTETYNAGDLIRFNSVTNEWDLQSSSGSYVGPWVINGSDIRRVGTGKVTVAENSVDGPAKLNIGSTNITPTSAEESILLHIGGNISYGSANEWSRAMSFGLRQEHSATMGIHGTGTNAGDDRYFYINVNDNADGLLAFDFWNQADFIIDKNGNVGIGGLPTAYKLEVFGPAYVSTNLDVVGIVSAASFSGNGANITNVNATNMTNNGTTTIRSGASTNGGIALQAESSDFALYDDNGYLSFGHTSNLGSYTATAQLDVRSDSEDAVGQFYSYGGNESSINLASSQGLISAPSLTTVSDRLGNINFGGDTGSGIVNTASISATASENFSTTTLGTQLGFSTTANGSNTQQENMRLTNDGRLLVGNSSLADATSNTLVVGGDAQISNALNVSGVTSLATTGITGVLSHTGTYGLTGNMTVSGSAIVNSLVSGNTFTNTGLLTNNGNAVINGTINVTGNATFDSDVDITGDLGITTLTVNSISGNTTTSTADFGTITAVNQVIAQGATNDVVFKGGVNDNFEILVDDATGIHLGNINTGGSVGSGLPVSFYTNDTEQMRILASGNIGVGTSTPTEKFHIQGNLRVEGTTDCTLGGGAGATNCTSDQRLKDNITNIDNALDKIKSLNGVEFDWNEKATSPGLHSIGVIAQEVQREFPTAVIENSEGWLAVDYAVLVSPLIEAVKELDRNQQMYKLMSEGIESSINENSRQIASLKSENEELKSEVQSLKDENTQMKQALCQLNSEFKFCQ